jgi:hypothetical protein
MGELDLIFEGEPSPDRSRHADDPGTAGKARRSRWWIWVGVAGVAGAVALGVTMMRSPSRAHQPGGPVASPVEPVDAVRVLHDAAAAALKEPDVAPRPDQFVYTRYADGGQVWRSADGGHDGLVVASGGTPTVLPACQNGNPATGTCAAYDPDLPTDPDVLVRSLNDGMPYDPGQPGDVNRVAKGIMTLLQDSYVRPGTRAALFDAAARIPGLRVDPEATDGAGRPGVGIAWSYGGTNELVFDAASHAFLGVTTTAGDGAKGSMWVVRVAIVDRAGQLPPN